MTDQALDFIINLLRAKDHLTDLEKDVLDTYHELSKQPMDMNSAFRQVQSNNSSHPDVLIAVSALPTTGRKSIAELTENDLRYVLTKQFGFLVAKESKLLQNSK